ncbi:hypothetical protein PENTCL1PPCAC_212, partial [Pristionchus entomophagus]
IQKSVPSAHSTRTILSRVGARSVECRDSGKRAANVTDLLGSESFVYMLNDRYSLKQIMDNGRRKIQRSIIQILEAVQTKQEKATLADMSRLGLVKNLGWMSSMPRGVALDEVMPISLPPSPHLSAPYIHACLRHIGYDATEAIDMIDSERVPARLRRL